jgi:hypothetical protein
MKKKGLWLSLLVCLLLLPAPVILADGPRITVEDGRIFVDEDVQLEPGETFRGDLGIFNGDLAAPKGSVVDGDVFLTNGDAEIGGEIRGSLAVIRGDLDLTESANLRQDLFIMSGGHEISGRVEGDLAVMFGDVVLKRTAVVEGDLVVLSGTIEREAGAQVLGDELRELPLPQFPLLREQLNLPEIRELTPVQPRAPQIQPTVPRIEPSVPRIQREMTGSSFGQFVGRVLMAGFLSLIFVALGLFIVLIWPRATHRVSECVRAMPVQSFLLGLLSFLIAAVLEAFAAVAMIVIILIGAALISTVILIPVGLLLILLSVLVLLPVPLALVAGIVLGWVALAELVGRAAVKVLKAGYVRPLGATLVGLLITVPIAAILWVIQPLCCAWPFIILLSSVGLGAVFHTRFGRQSCSQSKNTAEPELLPAAAMDEEAGEPDVPTGSNP